MNDTASSGNTAVSGGWIEGLGGVVTLRDTTLADTPRWSEAAGSTSQNLAA